MLRSLCLFSPLLTKITVITGFNTDVEYQGVTYHVQTEDKGLDTPMILSLVYQRGTILASKRSPYNDLLEEGFDEKVLAERLQRQHKLICAAVRAGRLEDLKRMTMRDSAAKAQAVPVRQDPAAANGTSEPPRPVKPLTPLPEPVEQRRGVTTKPHFEKPPEAIPQPKEDFIWDIPLEIIDDLPVIEIVDVIEDGAPVNFSEAPALPPVKEKLAIKIMNEDTFRGGERKTLNILVFRGAHKNSVSGSHIMVKVLGSSFRPLIFHAKTDTTGVATVHLQLPQFKSGRGALMVRATDQSEEAELRQIIRQS